MKYRCGHCRKLEPAFKRVAEVVTKHSSLVMGKIDATLNELDGINLSGSNHPEAVPAFLVCDAKLLVIPDSYSRPCLPAFYQSYSQW